MVTVTARAATSTGGLLSQPTKTNNLYPFVLSFRRVVAVLTVTTTIPIECDGDGDGDCNHRRRRSIYPIK